MSVFKIDPGTGERLGLLATATVGEGGWVDLPEPIIVRAGEAFMKASCSSFFDTRLGPCVPGWSSPKQPRNSRPPGLNTFPTTFPSPST